jgi:hypothetical protein
MNSSGQLYADNRIHTLDADATDTVGNEFDYDDPDCWDLYHDVEGPVVDEVGLRALRDFILNCSLYVSDLETALGQEQQEFWEAREHAYNIISTLLIDLYQYDFEE